MIYIIEDDENIRNLVQVALNGSGYETAAFETAEEALGAFKVKAPQLAIFDLMLPGMDGLEAIRKIRANDAWKKLPVLVLTAKDKGIRQGSRTGWGRRRLYDQALQRAGAAGTGAFPAAPY